MIPIFVTPDDMQLLYDADQLVQATNKNDVNTDEVDFEQLLAACNHGNAIVNGYVMALPIQGDFSDEFLEVLKSHAARLAWDFLAGEIPEVERQAKDSLEYLRWLGKLSATALQNLAGQASGSGEVDPVQVPSVAWAPGRQAWSAERLARW